MKALLSVPGALALEQLRTGNTVLAFDLDGTLAPLTAHRSQAFVPASTAARMEALMRDWPVAVITGRAVEDASERLNFSPHYLLGNHGAECRPTADGRMDWYAKHDSAQHTKSLDACRAQLAQWHPDFIEQGVQIEDKGLSIAIHYREAFFVSQTEQWLRSIFPPGGMTWSGRNEMQAVTVSWGHRVINIVGAAAPNKGHALLEIMRDCGASTALMVGDDINDEPAFAALPAGSVAVRIGAACSRVARGDESPAAASFNLPNQKMMEPFLDLLLSLRC